MIKKPALGQLQVIKMRTSMDLNYRVGNEPIWVEFSSGKKTIRMIEGQETVGSLVLKNSLIKKVEVWDGYEGFVARFRKITELVGRKVPIKRLVYWAYGIQDFWSFHQCYSGTICLKKINSI